MTDKTEGQTIDLRQSMAKVILDKKHMSLFLMFLTDEGGIGWLALAGFPDSLTAEIQALITNHYDELKNSLESKHGKRP
jgi:hypothetical protein